ncbi:MAG: hypothetical protein K5868_02545 [Lachnospiraceae bacterium]|nr:hypothetical protein [Lachnospiraceae bacterium]
MNCITNNNPDNSRNGYRSRRSLYISLFCFLSVFFFGMLVMWGVPMYNDSKQYIDMHVHREPVYPLFLWVMRLIAGENSLILAGIVQCVLAVYASYRFITYVLKSICLKSIATEKTSLFQWIVASALTFTVITPYIITPLMSVTHVMLANGILSEALALPLFLLYVINLHMMMVERTDAGKIQMRHVAVSLALAFILSLIRSQMIVTLIAWVIVAVISVFTDKMIIIKNDNNGNPRKLITVIVLALVFFASIPLRTTLTKSYNYIFNGRYVDNVYTKLTMLSNIFYVTDRESGALIEDEDLQSIFYRLYDVMDENEWSYKYAGDSAADRAIYLEDMHDKVKFDVLEAGFRDIMNERGMPDYIDYNLKAEEYSGKLIGILRPECFGKWFVDWMIMGCRGVVRSIAICHPVMYIYVVIVLVFSLIAMIRLIMRARKEKMTETYSAAALMFIALLLLFGNAFGTAFTIMCLSRYMIYVFPLFYSAIIAVIAELLNRRGSDRII